MTNKEKREFNREPMKKEEVLIVLFVFIAVIVFFIGIIVGATQTDEISNGTKATYTIEQTKIEKATEEPKQALNEAYTFVELAKEPILTKQVEMTFYLPTGNACANTEIPQENHTVAFCRDYLNCECDIYTLHGELIGHYVIDDTGYGRTEENGKGTIQNANCVDVFFEVESEGWKFIEKYGNEVIIKIYD